MRQGTEDGLRQVGHKELKPIKNHRSLKVVTFLVRPSRETPALDDTLITVFY